MRHKILFVIHKMGYGGAEKNMAFLANTFSLNGHDVYLLTYEDMTLKQKLVSNVKHVDCPQILSSFAIRRILQIIQVRRIINKIKPDVIISFLPYPNIISIFASLGMRAPIIISERGDPFALQGWFTKIRDFVYNFADGYVFQTYGAKSYYSNRIQSTAVVIQNPVIREDIPPRWTGCRENIIVHVGRLSLTQKRQDILISAFALISKKFPDIKLVLFGDGDDEVKIRKIVNDCGLEERVILAGVEKNIYEAIKKAKLFVLSSDYEGIPNALIEAMSVGLPCVSTDCSPGGAAELIKNMENGILVQTGCVEELATAMEFMLNNPQAAELMGQKALKALTDLDPEVIIGQWENYVNDRILAKLPAS